MACCLLCFSEDPVDENEIDPKKRGRLRRGRDTFDKSLMDSMLTPMCLAGCFCSCCCAVSISFFELNWSDILFLFCFSIIHATRFSANRSRTIPAVRDMPIAAALRLENVAKRTVLNFAYV